jgi:hypothetical protein
LQCPNFLEGAGSDEEQVLIPLEQFINTIIMLAVPSFMECLWHSTTLLPELKVKLDDSNSHWTNTDGVLHNEKDWILIPSNVSLQTEIIWLTHDVPHIGHPRISKTVELIECNY